MHVLALGGFALAMGGQRSGQLQGGRNCSGGPHSLGASLYVLQLALLLILNPLPLLLLELCERVLSNLGHKQMNS